MKKFLIFMCAAMAIGLAAVFAGCGGPTAGTAASPSVSPSASVSPSETPAASPSAAPSASPSDGVTMDVTLEGETETVPAVRAVSSLGYAVTYDPASFTRSEYDDGDVYRPSNNFENTSFSVTVMADTTAQEALDSMEIPQEALNALSQTTFGKESYDASHFAVSPDQNDDGVRVDTYLAERGGDTYLIQLCCPEEAAEGWGGRMAAMLNYFEFV